MINEFTRLQACFRRLHFEIAKLIGVFWLIERIPFMNIKEPFNRLYKRELRKEKIMTRKKEF